MGSFNYTCGISELPIGAGDPVRLLMMTESPFYVPGRMTCYMYDIWTPRAFPLRAIYNDYGSVEEIEEGVGLDLWFEGLKLDLVEQGTGDNACHDVPTSKNMKLDEFFTALQEGRLLVKGTKSEEKQKPENELHPGIPTMGRLRDIIKGAGLPLAEGYPSDGFLLDVQPNKFVRVRWGGFEGQVQKLNELSAHLGDFATMLTSGTGFCDYEAELLVAPKPLTKGFYNATFCEDDTRNLHVTQTMIREDVWQTILGLKFRHWNRKVPQDYESWRKATGSLWDEARKIPVTERDLWNSGNFVSAFIKDEGFVIGPGTHFEIALERGPSGEELRRFLDSVAEFAFVKFILMNLRHQWRAGTSCGPQFGEWELHKDYLEELSKVASGSLASVGDLDEEGES
jgi:hypothetical protein